MRIKSALVVLVVSLAVPVAAAAQSRGPAHRCTTASLSGGAASAASDVGVQFGGGAGAELVPGLTIEGRTTWLARDNGGSGLSVNLSAQFGWPRDRAIAPFVRGGVGIYRAIFDTTRAPLPGYYAARSTVSGPVGRLSFADPALIVGGGAGQYVMTSVSVWAVFHFEEHRVTPARGSR
jgi:hypothetical protein